MSVESRPVDSLSYTRSMRWKIIEGGALEELRKMPSRSVQCCVTSPPYWGLRDYGVDGQLGLEPSPAEYVERLVEVFGEVRRVLADDGVLWLNLGDSYSRSTVGHIKHKDLVGIPWRVAFALQSDGWYLRSDIIWHKPNPMPESVRDRPTKAHEYVFLLTKQARYYYDNVAIKELSTSGERFHGGYAAASPDGTQRNIRNGRHSQDNNSTLNRNRRDVWTVSTTPFSGAHFAVMPCKLVEPCIKAGSRLGDLILDPFSGSGTVGVVALRHGRSYVGLELNPEYAQMSRERIYDDAPLLNREDL
jgi:DNA modification methylase